MVVTSSLEHLNCFRKMLRFRLFLESRKVTSLGSFLVGAAEGSLGLAVGKEKSCSMLEKSGSTTSVQGLLSVAHMELRSRATLDGSFCQFSFFIRSVGGFTLR